MHELLDDPGVRSRLVERWGEDVVSDGRLDRRRVSTVVFKRPEELSWLEGVLHPRVGERFAAWRETLPSEVPIAVVEVPLLFETGMDGAFDATVAVVAEDETRADRAGARGTDLLERRSARQLSQEEKAARADHVLHNDGSLEDLETQAGRLMEALTTLERGAV